MKINVKVLVRCNFSPNGMTTAPAAMSFGALVVGIISSPAMLEKGDTIELDQLIVDHMCGIPSRLTFPGNQSPRLSVENRIFTLGKDGVLHGTLLCTLTMWSDSTSQAVTREGDSDISVRFQADKAKSCFNLYVLEALEKAGLKFDSYA